jgi:hypothetical protein
MSATVAIRAAALLLVVALAGCEDPYTHERTAPSPARTSPHAATPSDVDRPGAPPAGPLPKRPAREPVRTLARDAARSFAWQWVNWDWRTAARRQRALARLASGDLARQLDANAASARIDATLSRDRPGSRGVVAAINVSARGAQASGILVTREQTYTDGRADLGGRRYRVYLIGLKRDHQGWVVSAWQPQP